MNHRDVLIAEEQENSKGTTIVEVASAATEMAAAAEEASAETEMEIDGN